MIKNIIKIILLKKTGLLLMGIAILLIVTHRIFFCNSCINQSISQQSLVFEKDKLTSWFPMIGMGLFALGFVILAKSKNEGYQYLKKTA
jgi:hypothetical protein